MGMLPAKLSRPSLASNVLIRKRLFKVFDDGLRCGSVWVSGPPGAGKTTLVNSYLQNTKIKTLWYQVDSVDTDPATFFHYLGAWPAAATRKTSPLPRFSPQTATDIPAFACRFFQELFSGTKPPLAIVLDNFQEASHSPKFLEVICAALRTAPEGCAFVFISRTDPPAAFARACVNGNLSVVNWEDLRLSESEALSTAKLLGYGTSGISGQEGIHSKSKGWMAGFLLLLAQADSGAVTGKEMLNGAADASFNYFMTEVFDKLDQRTQELLVNTSMFQDMTPDMARELTGEKDSSRILSSLHAGNFFVSKRAHPHVSYHYHPLFREFLLKRAREVKSQEELKELMGRAALIAEREGHADDAARLLSEAADWIGLREFIHSNAERYISQGRLQGLEGLLRPIPAELVATSPWLLYYLGVSRMSESPSGARKSFEQAYALFLSADVREGAFLSWSGICDSILYEWKDLKQLDRWIDEFRGLMERYGYFPSNDVEVRATSSIFSALMFRQPENPDISKWEERVRSLVMGSKDFSHRLSITRNLILYYLWTGNVAKAGVLIEKLRPAPESTSGDPLAQLMWLRSAALHSLYIASAGDSQSFVEEGLRLAEKTGIHLLDTLYYGIGIYTCALTGDIKTAEDFLRRMRAELESERSMDLTYYHHQASIVALLKGEMNQAIEHAEIGCNLAAESGTVLNAGVFVFGLICMKIEAGRLEGIESSIEEIRTKGRLFKSHYYAFLSSYAEALLYYKRGRFCESLEKFAETLDICEKYGAKLLVIVFQPSSAAALCQMALEEGLKTGFVSELVRLNNLKRFPPHPGVEAWPWEFKIYTLGRFEIYREGKKIEFSRKAQQKPLALLKELVSFEGRPTAQDSIADALWPDSDGDLADRSFATTLHRLRKLLGCDKAIRYVDGMVSLDMSCFWVDAWAFNYYMEQAERHKEDSARLLEKAAALYHGEYLPSDALPSVISARERLRGRFKRCMEKLGKIHESASEMEKAIECYCRGIEADCLAENFYRRLMLCQKELGNRPEVINTYNRLKASLSEAFGIHPSAETEAIYLSAFKK